MIKYIYLLIFRKRKVRRGLPRMKNPPPPPPPKNALYMQNKVKVYTYEAHFIIEYKSGNIETLYSDADILYLRPNTTQTLYDNKQLDNAIDAWDKLKRTCKAKTTTPPKYFKRHKRPEIDD